MSARGTGGVLLLVEDDDSIGRLVKQYLEQQDGWRVVWLRSGEDAVSELRRHPIRLVVLDIGLPGIDGFEVCRRIRAGSKVPIIMLTARDEEPDRVAGLELGADDYVSKPFSPRELSARIKAILLAPRTEWPRIAQILRTAGIKVMMLTNGLALKKQAQQVIETVDQLTVSLDGATPETYRAIRGVDALPVILEGMRAIAEGAT